MLDLFDDNIFTVDEDENIARTEVCRVRPALGGAVERMRRCSNDLLAVDENVCQLGRFVDIGLNDLLERNVSGFFIPCPNKNPALIFSIATRPVAVATVVPATKHAPFFK